jgi:hypothetical protein
LLERLEAKILEHHQVRRPGGPSAQAASEPSADAKAANGSGAKRPQAQRPS